MAAGLGLGVVGGVLVALGHLAAELPYYVALLLLLERVEGRVRSARRVLDLVAAVFMLVFAGLLLSAAAGGPGSLGAGRALESPLAAFAAGVALTAGNAYFLLWWVTAGRPIVEGAKGLGWPGRLAVYGAHYSYDLGWLALLAGLGGVGGSLGGPVLRLLLAGLALVLVYYAARMLAPHISRR